MQLCLNRSVHCEQLLNESSFGLFFMVTVYKTFPRTNIQNCPLISCGFLVIYSELSGTDLAQSYNRIRILVQSLDKYEDLFFYVFSVYL